jgi:DNA-binding CsgD family transcriptional regulator
MPVRDRLVVRLGLLYVFKPDVERALGCVRAIDAARLDPDSPLAAEYHFLRARIHALRAELGAWHDAVERGLANYEKRRSSSDDFRIALSNASAEASALGDLALARALNLAERLKSGIDYERAMAAGVELLAGDLERARALLNGIAPVGRFSGRIVCVGAQTLLAALSGDEALASYIDLSMIRSAERGGQHSALAQLAGRFALGLDQLGRAGEARELLTRACASIVTVYDMNLPIGIMAMLQPKLALRLRPLVAAAAEPAEDRANRALLALIDAASARDNGDADAAATYGAEAAQRYAELGWPWLSARAHELAGNMARALEIQRRIGAYGEVRRLERAGLADPKPDKPGGALTARERELALLIAEGKGNRAAAEALSITEKAVEKYLTSIYAKLGMTSRAQLAAYIAAGRG